MSWLSAVTNFLVERPVLMIALVVLPLLPLAIFRKIHATRRLVVVLLVPCLVSLVVVFIPSLVTVVWIVDLLVGMVIVADLISIQSPRNIGAERVIGRIASQGKPQAVELTLVNRSTRWCRVDMMDDLPEEFEVEDPRMRVDLKPRSRTTVHYRFRPMLRGLFHLNCVHLRIRSRLKLWDCYPEIPAISRIHVYPDMKQLGQFELLARTNRLSLMGLRRSRRIGSENEFERLRDYTIDDNHRHIDWRATARRRELTVRDFQANQNQQVIFMLDCGRLMTGSSGEIPLFDHALNAMLMLSWIALSRGDSVGLLLFSDKVRKFVPPRTGKGHVNQMLHSTFDQFAQYTESRYDSAFLYLDQKIRKRSLVILVTNVIDDINATIVQEYLTIQAGKHLPLAVFLRDHELYEHARPENLAIAGAGHDANDVLLQRQAIAGAALRIIEWREQAISRLTNRGVLTLDTWPDKLTAPLVNRYLEIKARGLL